MSICLPNYNKQRFLHERIRTIQAQTFTDYEVIVADSGSTDGSAETLRSYALGDARVRYCEVGRGLYASWNHCISMARGEWLYFACSDDTMAHDCIERLVVAAEQDPDSDVITSRPWIIDDCGNEKQVRRETLWRWILGRRLTAGRLDEAAEFRAGLIIGTPTNSVTQMLIHRRAISRTGLFPVDEGASGDYLWQMRALRRCRFRYLPAKLGSWRRYETQATSSDEGIIRRDWARHAMILVSAGECPSDLRTKAALGYCLGRAGLVPGADQSFITREAARLARICGARLHPMLFALGIRVFPQWHHP